MNGNNESVLDVSRMHVINNGNDKRFCIISVANSKVWKSGVFYDQLSALEFIHELRGLLSESRLKQFSDMLEISKLPWTCMLDSIVIPSYAGCVLARAIDLFLASSSFRFKPYSAWPVMDEIPEYNYFTYTADEEYWAIESPTSEIVYNGLFGCYDIDDRPVVYVLNSREQWDDFLLGTDLLSNKQVAQVYQILDDAILPDVSHVEPIRLTGSLALHLFQVFRYDLYINEVFDSYRSCSWGSGSKDFDFLLN